MIKHVGRPKLDEIDNTGNKINEKEKGNLKNTILYVR